MAVLKMLLVFISLLVFVCTTLAVPASECFESQFLRPIPKDHLFHNKSKPLVLGHRGNPRHFQENTLDGFKSLLATNADGFELDIYLTKDEKLVCYHDDNTKNLTGEDHVMWETNAEDLTKVYVMQSIDYKGRIFNFTERRPLPMLEDVLAAMKDSGKLMYLEIKPSYLRDLTESKKVGKAVAQMVTEMGLVNQAVLNSFDPFKTLAAKQENPSISVGFFYKRNYWKPPYIQMIRSGLGLLPGMAECVAHSPSGTAFIDKMFKTGAAAKAINASFMDMDYKIYDNPLYSNNTFKTLRSNYSPEISAGAWTLYSMKNTDDEDKRQDEVIDNLVRQGAERLITDDVYRMLKKLGRSHAKLPTAAPVGAAAQSRTTTLLGLAVSFFLVFVFVF